MSRVWTAMILAGAGTYAMRASFFGFAHRMTTLAPWLQRVLRQIPPAALAALVAPALLRPSGHLDVTQARLFAGIAAGLVAWRTRSALLTLVVGMGVLLALRAL